MMKQLVRAWSMITVVVVVAMTAHATETKRWIIDTTEEFLKGEGEGVAVERDGRLERAPTWRAETTFEEPVSFAGAIDRDGSLIVGTGHPARLYRIEGGHKTQLAEVPAEQVAAILVAGDGSVYVSTMAPGALFRLVDGELKEVGRLGEGTIWDLAEFDGSVIAAAGPSAALYRVGSKGLERWLELPDVHARTMVVDGERVIVGTSGKGLILSVGKDRQIGLLSDSKFTEISDLTVAGDGSVWATALVGEPEPQPAKKNGAEKKNGETETTTIDLDLPKVNGSSATSEVLRVTPEGALLRVHRFSKQIASAVAWDGQGVLVGTGYEGELWRFVNSGGARLATLDAVHVVAVVGDGQALLTQGPAGVLQRRDSGDLARFRVDARRFKRPVVFGQFRIEPPASGIKIRFRSGISEKPDPTWLPWTPWVEGSGARVPLPPATSIQWEVDLGDIDHGADVVERVELAYREVNLAPVIDGLKVEEPGLVYLNAPPPAGPVIDVNHPDVSGIFSVIGEGLNGKPKTAKGKKYWRVGYRTVSWKAEDPNGDPLRFKLKMEDEHGFRLLVREDLKLTQLGIDVSAVPDGRYRFHLEASDREQNPGDEQMTRTASRWLVVDNTPPDIRIEQKGDRWAISVVDSRSAVVRAEWSRDGAAWQSLAPRDGLFDARREEFEIPVQNGRHHLVVRSVDRHHNRAAAGVVEE